MDNILPVGSTGGCESMLRGCRERGCRPVSTFGQPGKKKAEEPPSLQRTCLFCLTVGGKWKWPAGVKGQKTCQEFPRMYFKGNGDSERKGSLSFFYNTQSCVFISTLPPSEKKDNNEEKKEDRERERERERERGREITPCQWRQEEAWALCGWWGLVSVALWVAGLAPASAGSWLLGPVLRCCHSPLHHINYGISSLIPCLWSTRPVFQGCTLEQNQKTVRSPCSLLQKRTQSTLFWW